MRELVATGDVEAAWKHGNAVAKGASWEITPTVGKNDQQDQQGGEVVLPSAEALLARSAIAHAIDARSRHIASTVGKAASIAALLDLMRPNGGAPANVRLKAALGVLRMNDMDTGEHAGAKQLGSMGADELAAFIQRADAAIAAAGMGPAINVTPKAP